MIMKSAKITKYLILVAFSVTTAAFALDLNDDNLDDAWSALYPGLQVDDPETGDDCHPIREDNPDYDGSGATPYRNEYTNEVESLLGTNPFDSASAMPLRIDVIIDGTGGRQVKLTLPTVQGKIYQVEYGVGVQYEPEEFYDIVDCSGTRTIEGYYDWQPLEGGEVIGDGQEVSVYTNPPLDGEAMLFRYRFDREVDFDQDGIGQWTELQLGLRDDLKDTDGDGLEDLFELQNGFTAYLFDSDGDMLGGLGTDGSLPRDSTRYWKIPMVIRSTTATRIPTATVYRIPRIQRSHFGAERLFNMKGLSRVSGLSRPPPRPGRPRAGTER
jgi:hypothetical protein